MISSMTAFARKTHQGPWGSVTWEIRSVNHRYLEFSLRLPEPLRHLDSAVRECIRGSLHRGKVEATLRFQPGQEVPFDIVVNEALAKQLAEATKSVGQLFPNAALNVMDVLSWPGVLQTKNTQMEVVGKAMLTLLQETLDELVATRRREGDGLKNYLEERLGKLQTHTEQVEAQMPGVLEAGRQKMVARFEDLSVTLDEGRLEQEMVWLSQKVDIAEELQRLGAHVIEVQRVLAKGGVIGRRLDFLMQELNREANTLGSKSIDADIIKTVVELKVHIEQMREQVQNIE